MVTMQIAGRQLPLGRSGFLTNFYDWDDEVAETLAKDQGLTLTPRHWIVIQFLREYYEKFGHPPSPKNIINAVGKELSPHIPCTRRTLEGLFPAGGCKQACRIAGLPDYFCSSC